MGDSGEYQGSQAYAQTDSSNTSVNRNTGSLNYSKTIISLKGVAKSIGLSIRLSYSPGGIGGSGLPANWTWGTSFIVPQKSLTAQGKTYAIDFNWADANGYKSGLRYVNNRGMKLEYFVPSKPLPSNRPGQYAWRLRYTDGAMDYFDGAGKLREHQDIFGNSIYYKYMDSATTTAQAKIVSITDSWGQVVDFGYPANEGVRITAPDGGQTLVVTSPHGVERVTDSIGQTTTFDYARIDGQSVPTSIIHPSGLKYLVVYQSMLYKDDKGQQKSMPAVRDLIQRASDGAFLAQSNYIYGEASSGATYTGFKSGYRMGGKADAVMDGSPQYRYDVRVSHLSSSGKVLSASRVFYNFLHLPVQEFHYAINESGSFSDSHKATYTYDIDNDKHARAPNYSQPVKVLQERWVTTTNPPAYRPLRQVATSYDNYGCVTSMQNHCWSLSLQDWIKQTTNTNAYIVASWGGQVLQSETFVDDVSRFERRISYTWSGDQKTMSSSRVEFRPNASQNFLPWKTKSFAHDTCGRVVSETVAWSPQAPVPPGTVATYTSRVEYGYDTASRQSIVTTKDPKGNATVCRYLVKIPHGPLIQQSTPLGRTEYFEYDSAGRLRSYKDPLGKVTSNSYLVGASENSATSTTSLGYVTKELFDQMGRKISTLDNGDSTKPFSPAPNRVLSLTTYDGMSRLATQTNELGLRTTIDKYDGFGRQLQATDSLNNVTTHVYDDSGLVVKGFVNGDLRSSVLLDSYARPVKTISYGDSADINVKHSLVTENTYDGHGQVTKSTLSQQPLNGSPPSLLETTTISFDAEFLKSTETTTGKNSRENSSSDSIERTFVRDIFANSYTYTKVARYANGSSFTHPGPEIFYDECNRLVRHKNQLGQEEKYTYNKDGEMDSMTSFDNTTMTYNRDGAGRLTNILHGSGSLSYAYTGHGRLEEARVDGASASSVGYKYGLDGSMSSVTFPGGKQQSYSLDKSCRVVQSKDVHGTTQNTTFNASGLVTSRASSGDVVTYRYATVNHRNSVLVGEEVKGKQQIQRSIEYNGWHTPSGMTVKDTSSILLQAVYHYDSKGRLDEMETLSQKFPNSAELNQQRSYMYDGLNQLVKETIKDSKSGVVKTHQFAYDGNSNVIKYTVDSKVTIMSYNKIDQRVDPGFTYDANGRLHADDKGRTYTYNDYDQLIEAARPGTINRFKYNPDGALSSYDTGGRKVGMYYDAGAVNATEIQSNPTTAPTSYFMEPGSRISSVNRTSSESQYYIENQGSSALVLGPDGATASSYQAYGSSSSEGPARQHDDFGYRQEFTDSVSGAVYLRSRFYQPDNFSFLTMDSTPKENRYAYCQGDPINFFDGTGHSELWAMIAGIAVSLVLSIALNVAFVPVGAAIFGAESLAASIAGGAIAGAVGNTAGSAVAAAIQGDEFSIEQAAMDFLSGAIGGGLSGGTGTLAGSKAKQIAQDLSFKKTAVKAIRWSTAKVVGGSTNKLAITASDAILSTIPSSSSNTALESNAGGQFGVGAGGLASDSSPLDTLNKAIIPVSLTQPEVQVFNPAMQASSELVRLNNRVIIMTPDEEASATLGKSHQDSYKLSKAGRRAGLGGSAAGGADSAVSSPTNGKLFSKWLSQLQQANSLEQNGDQLRNMISHAGISDGHTIAKVTGIRPWASKWVLYPLAEDTSHRLYSS